MKADMLQIYAAWWRRLTPEQKAKLTETGFDPKRPSSSGIGLAYRYVDSDKEDGYDSDTKMQHGPRGYNVDSIQRREYRPEDYYLEPETHMTDRNYTKDEVLDIIAKIVSVLGDSEHPENRLQATCIFLAIGMPGQPNMTALAKEHSLTRAAISLRVKTIQRKLGLPPSVYMKSDYACARLKKKK
jgi:hypothetical protein